MPNCTVFYLKVNDVGRIISKHDTIPGDKNEYARTEKIAWQGTFSFFQPSNVGNRRSDAGLLNLIGGIYIFVFFLYLFFVSLYNNCHIKSLIILLCHN